MAAKKAAKFPKQLYVRRDLDDDPTIFLADADLSTYDETEECAVYELVSVGKVLVTRSFSDA